MSGKYALGWIPGCPDFRDWGPDWGETGYGWLP